MVGVRYKPGAIGPLWTTDVSDNTGDVPDVDVKDAVGAVVAALQSPVKRIATSLSSMRSPNRDGGSLAALCPPPSPL